MRMPGFTAEKSLDRRSNRFVGSIWIAQTPDISILPQAKIDPTKNLYDPSDINRICRPHSAHIKIPQFYCEESNSGIRCEFTGWREMDIWVPC